MFPPVDEELTWDDSTTPIALRTPTEEDADEELNCALVDTKLFDPDDNFVDMDDLTSDDSDEVFFDGSILEVTIKGKRKFSRSHPLRQQLMKRKQLNSSDYSKSENMDDEDEYDEENDVIQAGSIDYDPIDVENDDQSRSGNDDQNNEVSNSLMETRPTRQLLRVDYAMLHSTGKKEEKRS